MNKYLVRKALKSAFNELKRNRQFVASQYEIESKVESIIYKLAGEFEDAIKGKKFKNPETGNEVQFGSLPAEEQKKLRSQYKSTSKDVGKKDTKKDMVDEDEKEVKGLNDKFEKDAKHRKKVVKSIVGRVGGDAGKKGILEGVKKFVNAEDFKSFGEGVRKGDVGLVKKSMPGMMKGMLKGVLVVLGTALVVGKVGEVATKATKKVVDDIKKDMKKRLESDYDRLDDYSRTDDDVLARYEEDMSKIDDISIDAKLDNDLLEIVEDEQDKVLKKRGEIRNLVREQTQLVETMENKIQEMSKEIKDTEDSLKKNKDLISQVKSDKRDAESYLRSNMKLLGNEEEVLNKFNSDQESKKQSKVKISDLEKEVSDDKTKLEKLKLKSENINTKSDSFKDLMNTIKFTENSIKNKENLLQQNKDNLKKIMEREKDVIDKALKSKDNSEKLRKTVIGWREEYLKLEKKETEMSSQMQKDELRLKSLKELTDTYTKSLPEQKKLLEKADSIDFTSGDLSSIVDDVKATRQYKYLELDDPRDISRRREIDQEEFVSEGNKGKGSKGYKTNVDSEKYETLDKQLKKKAGGGLDMDTLASKLQKAFCDEMEKLNK